MQFVCVGLGVLCLLFCGFGFLALKTKKRKSTWGGVWKHCCVSIAAKLVVVVVVLVLLAFERTRVTIVVAAAYTSHALREQMFF